MSLKFEDLRRANIARLPQFRNRKGVIVHLPDGSDWTPAQWAQAVTGEWGEYASWRKQYERGDIDEETFKREASKELADVITYIDILAYRLGIDLGDVLISKFNEISERVGADIYLTADGVPCTFTLADLHPVPLDEIACCVCGRKAHGFAPCRPVPAGEISERFAARAAAGNGR